jgi:hydroxyacylglutathione hydrolase
MRRDSTLRRALCLFAVAWLACSSAPSVPVEELALQLENGDAPLVLDVRSDEEYAGGHIPGAVHLPFRSVADRHGELSAAPDDPIVVTCQHGPRAVWAVRSLHDAGYTNVSLLDGHMSGWTQAGLPTQNGIPAP